MWAPAATSVPVPNQEWANPTGVFYSGLGQSINNLWNLAFSRREDAAATAVPTSILLASGGIQTWGTEDLFDYSKLETVGGEALEQAVRLLMFDFPMLWCQDIKWALNALKGHYALTRKTLSEALKKSGNLSGKRRQSSTSSGHCFIDFQFEHGSVKINKRMRFLKSDRRRNRLETDETLEASLQRELKQFKQWAEHEDFLLAQQVNEDEYKEDSQLIECCCCYGEFVFEKMTQCSDGHLFCKECLVKYAQEAVFGSGRSELSCMEGGCTCSYPVRELEKVLPEKILCKYYERQAEEAVAAACGDELVRCPSCNFPALLEKDILQFSCPNPQCCKESCRKCHIRWEQHVGKTCEQVVEMDKTRVRFEERMTAARVRKCVKCGTGLVKIEGCNRITCRCGASMCYLCREPIGGYEHFCQHVHSPGKLCGQCHKCSVHTNSAQDDERIIQEIQKEGEAELNRNSPYRSGERLGPPPTQQGYHPFRTTEQAPIVVPNPSPAHIPDMVKRAKRKYDASIMAEVMDLFPDVQEDYVAELVQQHKDLNVVCNLLLENPACPRREAAAATAVPTSILQESGGTQTQETEDLFDYSKLETVKGKAMKQAVHLLMADFRMLSCLDIKWALSAFKGHYALTRKALSEALKKWQESGDPSGKRRKSRTTSQSRFIDFQFVNFNRRMFLLENERHSVKADATLEVSVQRELKQWAEHEGFLLALQVNEDQYKKEGQLIECGCCYGEFVFEKMTQCSDGHLFCKECLVKYAQEAVFGSGQSELSCMEGGCTCSYPVRELEKVLPEKILCKYNERQAEEAVAAACGDELVRCPSCNFPALLDKDMSLFSCPNPRCRKESCRKCHVQWKLHVGKTCKQVTETDNIRTRVLFEERMTAAWVRKCVKCRAGLVKTEGCNHMTCRCGSHMCYVCRKQIDNSHYTHFCNCNGRVVGCVCSHCGKCSRSGSSKRNDKQIIKAIQKEAEAELSKKSPHHSRKRVSPPLDLQAKKVARRA